MLSLCLRVVLALIFGVFGALKLFDLHGFVGNVENFQIAPFDQAPYAAWLAYVLVSLEVLVAVSLLTGVWLRGALILSSGMVLSFMLGIGSVWLRGLNIECGCSGGAISLGGYPTHMSILAVMLAASVFLVIDTLFPGDLPVGE